MVFRLQLWSTKTDCAKSGNSFITHQRCVQQLSFAVEALLCNNGSVMARRRAFTTHFTLVSHTTLLKKRLISKRVEHFCQHSNALPKNPPHVFLLLWHPRVWIVSESPSQEVQDVQQDVAPKHLKSRARAFEPSWKAVSVSFL